MSREIVGRIARVAENSPAEKAGIAAGDELLSVDGRPVRDILDFRFLTAEDSAQLGIRRNGVARSIIVRRDDDSEIGIEFEEELFDGIRTCRNDCVFCFLRQMPKGLRKSLYVRDDDFRLSFAHGNYISLTNVSDADMERIRSQRLGPLYVSVHATEPDLRARMFRNPEAGRIMERLRDLAAAKITVHAQIVLCPGINDGEHLDRTVSDLASLHPWGASIAIVPVGLTKHRKGLCAIEPVDAETAREVVSWCARRRREFRRSLGTRLIFASDEFYLLAGKRFPSSDAYEGFPQLEDGVGVCRIFLDELRGLKRNAGRRRLRAGRYALVTGALAGPMVQSLADLLSQHEGVTARVCIIKNRFLGESVTVAGLLAGRDIADAARECDSDEELLIPSVALNEGRFLDDMTVSDIESAAGRRVTVVPPSPRAVLRILAETGRGQ